MEQEEVKSEEGKNDLQRILSSLLLLEKRIEHLEAKQLSDLVLRAEVNDLRDKMNKMSKALL